MHPMTPIMHNRSKAAQNTALQYMIDGPLLVVEETLSQQSKGAAVTSLLSRPPTSCSVIVSCITICGSIGCPKATAPHVYTITSKDLNSTGLTHLL